MVGASGEGVCMSICCAGELESLLSRQTDEMVSLTKTEGFLLTQRHIREQFVPSCDILLEGVEWRGKLNQILSRDLFSFHGSISL